MLTCIFNDFTLILRLLKLQFFFKETVVKTESHRLNVEISFLHIKSKEILREKFGNISEMASLLHFIV